MFALIDGNNFYASCERIFQPELRGRPLVVLSNNDGCAIARSEEAKALGITMGHPIHKVEPRVRRQLAIRSANFGLYGDISSRIGAILRQAVPRVEVYSIDESFLDLAGIAQRKALATELHERVQRWTGIPNCVGIAPTKTLAKLANHVAKDAARKPGSYPADLARVCDLAELSPRQLDAVLRATEVGDVWGIGRRWAARLQSRGIATAADLRDAPSEDLLSEFGVVMARTQRELQGHSCLELAEVEPDRKQILVSRSFGEWIGDPQQMSEALATFAMRATEKLRAQGLTAGVVGIFAETDPFRLGMPQHNPSRTAQLTSATSDSRLVLGAVRRLGTSLMRAGYRYKKAGVFLADLARPDQLQDDLFAPARAGNDVLMETLDAINRRFGRNVAGLGASGWQRSACWHSRQESLSGRFTTRMADLPRARC
ncbi:DNA polymerase V [Pseudoxanthomonas sp. GM95]|uniref:Y-family DNA polymerase n=1 Tax=Pseudoxanthomonas sp. GM95 TaxID=1881043 RepID=UPI0008B6F8E7|nr:Y-family DNA polymerase [Pseudoxanthomonas sp. GM95]SEL93933.1 DNA polymerase V [Pseudoxanthomonas sp. GM95]